MLTGLHNRIPAHIYHAEPGLSNSGLHLFDKTPSHYKAGFTKTTKAFDFGKAFHDALLLPDIFDREYAIYPEGLDGRTKDGKKWSKEAKGKTLISFDDGQHINGMIEAIMNHDTARSLLENGIPERSCFWVHKKWGIRCKARIDFDNLIHKVIVDAKSCRSADEDSFTRDIVNFHYHWQPYWYLEGRNACGGDYKEFIWIAVEKIPPYAVATYIPDDEMLYLAGEQIKLLLEKFVQCQSSNVWPGYPDRIQVATLPRWYVKKFGGA